jgi:hypothetical protein
MQLLQTSGNQDGGINGQPLVMVRESKTGHPV